MINEQLGYFKEHRDKKAVLSQRWPRNVPYIRPKEKNPVLPVAVRP